MRTTLWIRLGSTLLSSLLVIRMLLVWDGPLWRYELFAVIALNLFSLGIKYIPRWVSGQPLLNE